jgi:replicative DNA helicase
MAKDKQQDRRENGTNNSWSNRTRLQEANLPAYSKLPPQAPDLEEAVLSAILIEKEAMTKVLDILEADSFYKPAHQEIYRSMRRLFERSQPIDLLMVMEDLKKAGVLDKVGGAAYLAQLTSKVTSSANIEYHARIVTEKFIQRELIRTSTEIIKDAYEDGTDVLDLLDKAGNYVFEITERNMGKQVADMGTLANQLLEQLTMLREKEDGLTGVPTGFTELDRLTSGFQSSDLIIIAARPAMGKTSFVLSIARAAAVEYGRGVALFSLEMSAAQLAGRIFSQDAEVNGQKMRNGKFDDAEWDRLVEAMNRIGEAPIYIDDTAGINVFELRAKCRRLKLEKDISMVIIDYLQLMSGAGESNKGMNREQEVSGISRALKGLAKELEVPVIALSQLSRAVETRGGDKRPQLSDLRESGCLTGDTLVTLADSGKQVPVETLVWKYPKGGFNVWAVDENYRIVKASVSNAFSTGIKETYELTTSLGRKIRATANHKFLTINGWKRLDELTIGDHLGLPRKIQSVDERNTDTGNAELALLDHSIGDGCTLLRHSVQNTIRELDPAKIVEGAVLENSLEPRTASTNRDVTLKSVWRSIAVPAVQKTGLTAREMQAGIGTNDCGTALYESNPSQKRAVRVADVVEPSELKQLPTSGVYWDPLVSITKARTEEVYDLTVPGPQNFVANNIIVHNSIEQDADMVMFLYRPEYYGIEEDEQGNSLKGTATIIVGKNRHGEARDIRLAFESDFARFSDLDDPDFDLLPDTAIQAGQPYGSTTIPSKMNNTDEDIPF